MMTSERYLSLPDQFDQNGNRIKDELIAGEVVKMRPPWHRHDLIKNRINELLYLFLHANQHLRLSSNVGMAVEISQHDTFVPDVSVIRKDRLGVSRESSVERLSSLSRWRLPRMRPHA